MKSNIGHLEGAAGLASVIKATLAIENHYIPPNMHFRKPNKNINFDKWKLKVLGQGLNWPNNDRMRRISINSFGYGGSNAHVVLEAYHGPVAKSTTKALSNGHSLTQPFSNGFESLARPFIVPITSHSENAGKKLESKLWKYADDHPDCNMVDLAHSLSYRRSKHALRTFLLAKDVDSLKEQLETPHNRASWISKRPTSHRIGFVMTGQGAKWPTMGRQLIERSRCFRKSMERCNAILQWLPDKPTWSVVDELCKPRGSSHLNESEYSQPLCTAIQLGLIVLLKQWKIHPTACCGHSSGEIAASYAAGILTFETALIYAYYRGLYTSKNRPEALPISGSMLAVGMSESEAEYLVKDFDGRLVVAAINSPTNCTISGDESAILQLKSELDKQKVFARQLVVPQAYHSHHMVPFSKTYEDAIRNCAETKATSKATSQMFSSVTARPADPRKMGPAYWAQNLVSPVRFSDALTGVLLDSDDYKNVDILIEIGPHAALKGPSRQVMSSVKCEIPYLGTLNRSQDDFDAILSTVGNLYALGVPVDFDLVNENVSPERLRDLPSYAWDHSIYWAETRYTKEYLRRSKRHPLLGFPLPGWTDSSQRWRGFLRTTELPWLKDHKIQGVTIFPAAGYLSMAVESALYAFEDCEVSAIDLQNVKIKSALQLPNGESGREVITELSKTQEDSRQGSSFSFVISSFDDEAKCIEHCSGNIIVKSDGRRDPTLSLSDTLDQVAPLDRTISKTIFYKSLHQVGLQHGESFQLIERNVESGPGSTSTEFRFEDISEDPVKSLIHPSWLDAALHPLFAALEALIDKPIEEAFVPTSIRSVQITRACIVHFRRKCLLNEHSMHVFAKAKEASLRTVHGSIHIKSLDQSSAFVQMNDIELTVLGNASTRPTRSLFSRLRWLPAFDASGFKHDIGIEDASV